MYRINEVLRFEEANEAARTTALNTLQRDPFGVLTLSFQTFGDYFNKTILRENIRNDLGMDESQRRQYAEFQRKFEAFVLLPGKPQPLTLTMKLYRTVVPWAMFLLFTPVLCATALLRAGGNRRILTAELLLAASTCVATATFMAVYPVIRYLHPVAWLVFFPLALLADEALDGTRSSHCKEPVDAAKPLRGSV